MTPEVGKLKTVAIIAEFNPFHNGHELIIRKARELTGADRVVILMSGDYVQRGAPAITARHVRAKMALLGGADAVLNYPTRFATSSAEGFAENAIRLLSDLNCIDTLMFGSECGDLERMQEAARALHQESDSFSAKLHEGLKNGLSFAKARAEALPEFADVLNGPNNILGVEYLKAILKTGSKIVPWTISREGAPHQDESVIGKLSSAAAVRHALITGTSVPGLDGSIPPLSFNVLKEDIGFYGITTIQDYSLLLADRLWKENDPAVLARYQDVTEDLANTIINKRNLFRNYEEFADTIKSKSITMTHINRALLHIVLGILKRDPSEIALSTQVLGFKASSEDLISEMRKSSSIPVILRPSSESAALSPEARRLFDEETRVSNLYETVRSQKSGQPFVNTLSKEIVKV